MDTPRLSRSDSITSNASNFSEMSQRSGKNLMRKTVDKLFRRKPSTSLAASYDSKQDKLLISQIKRSDSQHSDAASHLEQELQRELAILKAAHEDLGAQAVILSAELQETKGEADALRAELSEAVARLTPSPRTHSKGEAALPEGNISFTAPSSIFETPAESFSVNGASQDSRPLPEEVHRSQTADSNFETKAKSDAAAAKAQSAQAEIERLQYLVIQSQDEVSRLENELKAKEGAFKALTTDSAEDKLAAQEEAAALQNALKEAQKEISRLRTEVAGFEAARTILTCTAEAEVKRLHELLKKSEAASKALESELEDTKSALELLEAALAGEKSAAKCESVRLEGALSSAHKEVARLRFELDAQEKVMHAANSANIQPAFAEIERLKGLLAQGSAVGACALKEANQRVAKAQKEKDAALMEAASAVSSSKIWATHCAALEVIVQRLLAGIEEKEKIQEDLDNALKNMRLSRAVVIKAVHGNSTYLGDYEDALFVGTRQQDLSLQSANDDYKRSETGVDTADSAVEGPLRKLESAGDAADSDVSMAIAAVHGIETRSKLSLVPSYGRSVNYKASVSKQKLVVSTPDKKEGKVGASAGAWVVKAGVVVMAAAVASMAMSTGKARAHGGFRVSKK